MATGKLSHGGLGGRTIRGGSAVGIQTRLCHAGHGVQQRGLVVSGWRRI